MKAKIEIEIDFPETWHDATDAEVRDFLWQLMINGPQCNSLESALNAMTVKDMTEGLKQAAVDSYKEEAAIMDTAKIVSFEIEQ